MASTEKNCWKLMLSEGWKCYFRDPVFQNLPGKHAPGPPSSWRLRRSWLAPLINLTLLRHCFCSQRQRLVRKLRDIYNDCTLRAKKSHQISRSFPPSHPIKSLLCFTTALCVFLPIVVYCHILCSVCYFFFCLRCCVLGLTFSQLFINPALVPCLCDGLYGRAVS